MENLGLSRRTFLLSVGASSILAACGGGSGTTLGPTPGTCSASTARIPLTIDATLTDLPAGTPVYVYVIGEIKTSGGVVTQYYLDANGIPHVMSAADNVQSAGSYASQLGASGTIGTSSYIDYAQKNYPTTWADYSIPVTVGCKTVLDLSNINAQNMPDIGTGTAAFSGRIYISVGVPKLPFTPQSSSQYTAPVTIDGPGEYTLFDWIEFSYDSAGNFNGNTTQVDQFGFPLQLNGTPGGTLQGQYNMKRSDILAAVTALGSDFDVPVAVPPTASTGTYPAGISTLRALSPKSITGQNSYSGALSTYFDTTIQDWYTTWQGTPLVTNDLSTGPYTGIVTAGQLTFYQGSYPTLTGLQTANPAVAFTVGSTNSPGIPSYDVWQCANSLATGSGAAKNVQKMLAAALNRGVMSNSLDDATCQNASSTFYTNANTAPYAFNTWAQLFHQVSTNKLAYAFPYDDVCNQNPSIGLTGTTSVTIALGKFFS